MPITEELKNIQKLESVGFDHKQAEALADIIEQAQVNGQESLKDFIRSEIKSLHDKLDSKIDNKINELELRIERSLRDLLIKIFGIIVGTVGVAVTIIKLF